jgi:hypothetical protein
MAPIPFDVMSDAERLTAFTKVVKVAKAVGEAVPIGYSSRSSHADRLRSR